MATAQQSTANRNVQLRDPDVMELLSQDEPPACSMPGTDPTWWDLETHHHGGSWSCSACRAAIAVCDECPLKIRCADIGRKIGDPWFIYAGKSWLPYNRVNWACRWCRAPLQGPGRKRPSGMCSRGCERLYDEAMQAVA